MCGAKTVNITMAAIIRFVFLQTILADDVRRGGKNEGRNTEILEIQNGPARIGPIPHTGPGRIGRTTGHGPHRREQEENSNGTGRIGRTTGGHGNIGAGKETIGE